VKRGLSPAPKGGVGEASFPRRPPGKEPVLKRLLLLACTALLTASVAQAALAAPTGSPHFIGSQMHATVNADGSLTVSFKEAGLPSGAVETVTVTATRHATWFCVNNGGSNPSASNKRSADDTPGVSGTFEADRNGNIVGSETISAPTQPSDFSCPPGQTATLGSVTYSNVKVTDETSGAEYTFTGSFSTGCLLPEGTRLKGSCT
jgi:hypothetical protein